MSMLQTYRARDPFALARELFGVDPYRVADASVTRHVFAPAFELKEDKDAYVLHADVPGVREEDIDISLHQNRLTVSGTRAAEERKEGETYHVAERLFGSFSRTLVLPDDANGEAIEAKLASGVLTVRIGKKPESQPRRIALSK